MTSASSPIVSPPPGTTIYIGPAPRIPFTVAAIPEIGNS
jgi:hypothetical protein